MIYTARYNTLQTGKWRGLMDAAPRQLPVFADVRGLRFSADDADVIVLKSAADYEQASAGAEPVQMLGHSMQAVRLPKGGLLTYRFFVEREGDYSLTTALIPTHAVDAGGSHQLTIQALDDHVVVDQWKLSTSSQSYCHY